MRDLSVMEIEQVSGGGFLDWLSAFGEAVITAFANVMTGSPGMTDQQMQMARECIERGGSVSVINNGGQLEVGFSPPVPGRLPTLGLGIDRGYTSYICKMP